jgi:aspartate racemase
LKNPDIYRDSLVYGGITMAKTIGVIGGMGPQATVDFFQKILDNTRVERDQDHIHVIIDNNPQIPDRTVFLLGREKAR